MNTIIPEVLRVIRQGYRLSLGASFLSSFLSFIKAYVHTKWFARRAEFPATDVTDRSVPFCLLLACESTRFFRLKFLNKSTTSYLKRDTNTVHSLCIERNHGMSCIANDEGFI